jgi:hypothetical protein
MIAAEFAGLAESFAAAVVSAYTGPGEIRLWARGDENMPRMTEPRRPYGVVDYVAAGMGWDRDLAGGAGSTWVGMQVTAVGTVPLDALAFLDRVRRLVADPTFVERLPAVTACVSDGPPSSPTEVGTVANVTETYLLHTIAT